MKTWMRFSKILIIVTLLGSVGCQNKAFDVAPAEPGPGFIPPGPTPVPTPPGPYPTPTPIVRTCREVLQTIQVPVKVLFVVDTSGSNLQADDGGIGSDPYKTYRGNSIQAFFNSYSTMPNFSWGFITFQDYTANAIIGWSPEQPAFTASPLDMQQAIESFYQIEDNYNTPYRSALGLASSAIYGDFPSTPHTKYVVVFLSDGMPVPSVAEQTLISDVQNLVATAPGQVSFNTIYYGSINQEASTRLYNMSVAGLGRFLDTNTPNGRSFPIESVIRIPGIDCTPF